MKTLITLVALLFVCKSPSEKKLTLTIKILPPLAKIFRNQPIDIDISTSDFTYKSSVLVPDSLNLTFNLKKASVVWVTLDGLAQYADSSTRYFHNGARITLSNSSTVRTLTFPIDCEVNRYLGGKLCPGCKTSDAVIPIYWGLPSPDLKGEIGVDFQLGGCVTSGCDPTWFCRKDTLEF
ncbi:hypothetical protein [Flavihumibacter petaseus]|uniref:Uncharacterized protein n=1 Tax=Flavihumibacter petaseus NBRC 106054 TaxID=1220578 RepID=A0A0E9N4F3_9BACT|nr:hypothetical protein [Flavihumibacter petaseus]GAO44541.1 hypothetical protein FPE01S_03_05790 [Flavihumibacter petaseus NBRC 106054]